MRRSLPILAVAFLVTLAGCNALTGPTTPSPTAGPTTAGVVTTVNRTTLPARSPPGIENGTLVHPIELVDAHASLLRNSSYTLRANQTVTTPNGTVVYRQNATTRISADHAGYRTTITTVGRPGMNVILGASSGRVETRSNDTVAVTRVHTGNATNYLNASHESPTYTGTNSDRIYFLLTATDPTVARPAAPESTTVVLRATAAPADRRESIARQFNPHPVTNVSNVSFRAVVRPSGLVESYSLFYEARWQNRTVHVTENAAFSRLNETTASRPAWVPTALNRTHGGQTGQ